MGPGGLRWDAPSFGVLLWCHGGTLGRVESPILQRRQEGEVRPFSTAYPCESGMLMSRAKAFTGDAVLVVMVAAGLVVVLPVGGTITGHCVQECVSG